MSTIAQVSAPTLEHDGKVCRMFFVRGRMRSGTNWICNLLNLHPEINCQGEFHFEKLHDGFRFFMNGAEYSIGSDIAEVARLSYRDTVKRCLAQRVDRKPDASWVGDRTPCRIDDWFEGVPVIHTVRDGRDALVSWLLHAAVRSARDGRDEIINWFSVVADRHSVQDPLGVEPWVDAYLSDPELFKRSPHRLVENELIFRLGVREWRDHVRHDLAAVSRIHGGQWDIPLHSIKYEDLHAETETVRRGMYEFLGLSPECAMPLSRETGTLPGEAVGYGIGKASVGAWREFFTEEAKDWFKEEAGELLVELEYEKDLNW